MAREIYHPTADSVSGTETIPDERPGLILWDLDGPIYDGHLIYDLARAQAEEDLLDGRVRDAILDHRDRFVLSDSPDYNQLIRDVNNLWAQGLAAKGVPVEALMQHALDYMTRNPHSFRQYVGEAFGVARGNNYRNVLLTNEPPFVAEAASIIVGADGQIAAEWETTGVDELHGQLTGEIKRFQDEENKKQVAQKFKIDRIQRPHRRPTLGFGDSSGDMGFLLQVDFPGVTFSHDQKLLNIVDQIGCYQDSSGATIYVGGKKLRRIPDFNDGKEIIEFIRAVTSGNFCIDYKTASDSFIAISGLPLWMSNSKDIQLRDQSQSPFEARV